jgi:predicted N-acetyltransferase YhbS
MEIRCYDDADEPAVIALWRNVLPDKAPHNDPATAIRNKLAVERDLFFVAMIGGAMVGTVLPAANRPGMSAIVRAEPPIEPNRAPRSTL